MNCPERVITLCTPFFLQAAEVAFSISNVTIIIIIILILLLITAITSGAETAYFSLTAKDVNYLKTKDHLSARQAMQLLDQPQMLLATILVSNTLTNIAIIISIHTLLRHLMPKELNGLLEMALSVVTATFMLILFGEVLPKVYASQNNMRMTLFAAPVLRSLSSLLSPISRLLVSSNSFIEERIGQKPNLQLANEDFEQAIEASMGHAVSREEVNIFKGIVKFGNITVRQIMRTRLDVTGLPNDLTFRELQSTLSESGYSRLPVYRDSLDYIVGMIHVKDLLPYIDANELDWHTLIRPAYFVHEGKLIEDLIKEFQQKRIHFAIVVDEFGGTSGIVTLEDIMEEIIGDIKDEFDDDDANFKKLDERNFIFEGKTLVNDMCRVVGIHPESFKKVRGESDSLAGLVLEIAGRFPAINETISHQNFEFTVLSLEKRRIQRIKLTVLEQADVDDA